jgi:hypothetical protein
VLFRQSYEFIRRANYFRLPGIVISAKISRISAILQCFSAKVANLSAEPIILSFPHWDISQVKNLSAI